MDKLRLLFPFFLLNSAFFAFAFLYFHFFSHWYQRSIFATEIFSYILILTIGVALSVFQVRLLQKSDNENLKNDALPFLSYAVIFYAFFLFFMTMMNYHRMVSPSIDVQYFHAELSKLSRFTLPTYEWSQHFSPILFLIVPIYWVFQNADVLMVIQAIVFLSGAIPIYLIAKKYLHSRFFEIILAYAYLAFGGTQFGIAYGFHEILFFPTLFLWMYYFYTQKKMKWYVLFVLLCLFVKEEVSFIMMFWGAYLFVIKKDRKLGFLSSSLGALWYIFCFHFFFPTFAPNGFGYWGQYNQTYGKGVLGILLSMITKPIDFLKLLVTPSFKIDTFFQSFGAYGFLLFLFPPSFLIVLPSLLEKLMSTNGVTAMNGTHYSAALAGVTVVATLEALHAMGRQKHLSKFFGNVYLFSGFFLFYSAFFLNMLYGYYAFSLVPSVHRVGYPIGHVTVNPSDENLALLSRVIDQIPPQASVSAQYQILPHIHRSYTLLYDPKMPEQSDYVLFDTQLPPPVLMDTKVVNEYLSEISQNKNYTLVVNALGIVMYKKN